MNNIFLIAVTYHWRYSGLAFAASKSYHFDNSNRITSVHYPAGMMPLSLCYSITEMQNNTFLEGKRNPDKYRANESVRSEINREQYLPSSFAQIHFLYFDSSKKMILCSWEEGRGHGVLTEKGASVMSEVKLGR